GREPRLAPVRSMTVAPARPDRRARAPRPYDGRRGPGRADRVRHNLDTRELTRFVHTNGRWAVDERRGWQAGPCNGYSAPGCGRSRRPARLRIRLVGSAPGPDPFRAPRGSTVAPRSKSGLSGRADLAPD